MNEDRAPRAIVFGFLALFLLGIGSFALAFHTFPDRLRAPFNLPPPGAANPLAFSGDFENELEGATKDTDQDGIPDIREREVYGTSPYLPDTDSDGFSDKEELDAGEDPNCPRGTDCQAFRFPSAREVEQERIAKSLYESTLAAKLAESGIPGVTDAPAIRNFLRQAGIAEEILGQFDDKALVKIFQESARNPSPPPPTLILPPEGGGKPGAERGIVRGAGSGEGKAGQLPENPTAAQIRELLSGSGIEKSVLEKFNDEQLIGLYKDALKDLQR
ncbi:hypothetical protein HYW17_01615 [Candidatus Uhrbacteria bacterium]|nr:hypothetical protein [Candidatus Uhrbacteria bacterium]